MTSTNRAFIEAYRSPPGRRASSDSAPGGAPFIGTSELVSATAPIDLPVIVPDEAQGRDDSVLPAGPQPSRGLFRSGTTGSRSVKRPLSSLRGDAALSLDEVVAEEAQGERYLTNQPKWPLSCQQLLAAAAEQYDAVLRKLPADSYNGVMVGIVGAAREAGCTTTAICFALRSAALGYSTALVDGDLVNPALAQLLDVESYEPWEQLLNSGQPVTSALVPADDVGVDLLLAGPTAANELDAPARFRASLAAGALRRKYQRVIVDLGQAVSADGANLAVDLAAAMGIDHLIAFSSPRSTSEQLDAALHDLDSHGLDVAGIVAAA
jgi:Mrp family chromosome partitioning ATPase